MGDVQVSKQPSDIVGRGLERERPIAVGRAAAPLLLERNHSAGAGEKREYEANGAESFPGKGRLRPQDEEMRQLRRQLSDVTMERDILKKAVAIFSQRPK